MKYLLFNVVDNDIQYVIVSTEVIYLINEKEYALLKDSENFQTIKGFKNIVKEKISKLSTLKGNTTVNLIDSQNNELLTLDFASISLRKKFIKAFPDFHRKTDNSKKRIKPINALVVMLFAYSFIWAGTRPNSADINPEGIRWRLAYLNVQLLEWLNIQIGQKSILIIGLILLLTLLYLIFKPELWYLFTKELIYSNTRIKKTTDNIV